MKFINDIKEMRNWIILIITGFICYFIVNNIGIIGDIFLKIIEVFKPFLIGICIAFILNIFATRIASILKKFIKNKKVIKYSSIILAIVVLLGVIIFIAFQLIPELIANLELLFSNLPKILQSLEDMIIDLLDKYPYIQEKILSMINEMGSFSEILGNIINYLVNGVISFASSLVNSFITLFTAFVFAIYMLSQKEYLIKVVKKILYVIFDKQKVGSIIEILKIINVTFSKFILGQCVEAIILGVLIFITCAVAGFPYVLIISVLTAVTALIPFFGALIAMVIGAILIGTTSIPNAILFMVLFQVVQQIEGNLIYPRVVGKSVGLSPLCTLLAITVGGSLFGIIGMFISIPIASVIYTIIKNMVNNKLKDKAIVVS